MIHRLRPAPGSRVRRVLAGNVAKYGATYLPEASYGASDYRGHNLEAGSLLEGPYFPRIFPTREPEEEACRARGEVHREPRNLSPTEKFRLSLASRASDA